MNPVGDKQKATALKYARNIQYQKAIVDKVQDLIVDLVDLPSQQQWQGAGPSASDIVLFKNALALLQPKDFDDVILERNIYDKCGFALCTQTKLDLSPVLRDAVFRGMKGSSFKLTTKEELGKWCSVRCAEKALFVRLQLSSEPPWARDPHNQTIILPDESTVPGETSDPEASQPQEGLATALQNLAIQETKGSLLKDHVEELALERGDNGQITIDDTLLTDIQERAEISPPSTHEPERLATHDQVEGHQPVDIQKILAQLSREPPPD